MQSPPLRGHRLLKTALQLGDSSLVPSRAVAPPVIALGGGGMTLTAVLRLLHKACIPVHVLCSEPGFSRHSRWYRPLAVEPTSATPENLSAVLAGLPFEKAVIMPCADDWLAAAAALPRELAARFPSSLASAAAIDSLVDKWKFAQLLDRELVPHPRTQLLYSNEHLESLPERDFQGAILKPLCSVEFSRAHGVKGFLVQSRAAARSAMQKAPFPIMLQEFIPGPPTAGCFVEGFLDRSGRMTALFARRRLRMSPPRLGNSTFMVSVPLEEVAGAVAPLQFLLERISYRGIFSAEFKLDARDGLFKLFEINARPWWFIEAPARAGIDVCRMAYVDALGFEVEPSHGYDAGQYFGYLFDDYRAWRSQRSQGGPGFWQWLTSWRGVHSTPFSWQDPMPALALAWQQLSAYARGQHSHRPQVQIDPAMEAAHVPVAQARAAGISET